MVNERPAYKDSRAWEYQCRPAQISLLEDIILPRNGPYLEVPKEDATLYQDQREATDFIIQARRGDMNVGVAFRAHRIYPYSVTIRHQRFAPDGKTVTNGNLEHSKILRGEVSYYLQTWHDPDTGELQQDALGRPIFAWLNLEWYRKEWNAGRPIPEDGYPRVREVGWPSGWTHFYKYQVNQLRRRFDAFIILLGEDLPAEAAPPVELAQPPRQDYQPSMFR